MQLHIFVQFQVDMKSHSYTQLPRDIKKNRQNVQLQVYKNLQQKKRRRKTISTSFIPKLSTRCNYRLGQHNQQGLIEALESAPTHRV
jgi:hypothetical protein